MGKYTSSEITAFLRDTEFAVGELFKVRRALLREKKAGEVETPMDGTPRIKMVFPDKECVWMKSHGGLKLFPEECLEMLTPSVVCAIFEPLFVRFCRQVCEVFFPRIISEEFFCPIRCP